MPQAETQFPYWKLDDPRRLLGQTRAVALMRSDKRASYKHHALIEFHWGFANKKYGWTSLASVRRIHEILKERNPLGQPGMTTRHIGEANRDLCKWGWLFELDKGKGRNASRFLPNYTVFEIAASGNFSKFLNGEISCSVSPVGTHNGYEISVSPMGLHMRVPYGDTQITVAYPMQGHEDSLTQTGLLDRSTEREIEPAAPTAPPPAGPVGAAGAETAQEETKATTTTKTGFDELWRASDYKRGKTEARRAYAKQAPDAELHAAMVASAKAWKESWAAQGKPDAPRYTLAKWIEREDYECEPPTAYKPKERKAKSVVLQNEKQLTSTQPTARGKFTGTLRILEAEELGNPFGDSRCRIKLDGPSGEQEHVLKCLIDGGAPAEDLGVVNELRRAFGGDTGHWPGGRVRLEMDGERIAAVVVE
jgi:hypothetical protein